MDDYSLTKSEEKWGVAIVLGLLLFAAVAMLYTGITKHYTSELPNTTEVIKNKWALSHQFYKKPPQNFFQK